MATAATTTDLPGVRLTPVAAGERIVTLDVVRGFALLGIFLMNVEFFSRPIAELGIGMAPAARGLDYLVGWLVHVFVRGKFWTMFSLLFGMGFAVMLTRAEQRGSGFAAPYLRRTLVLGLLGVLHYVFLWAGDILFSYAVAAAILLLVYALVARPMRRWPSAGLRNAGLVLFLGPFLAMAVGSGLMLASPSPPEAEARQAQVQRIAAREAAAATERRVLSSGSYAEVVAYRTAELPKHMRTNAMFAVLVAGVFLVGAWFVRSGVMLDPAAHLGLFRNLAIWGLPVGLGLSIVSALVATTYLPGQNDARFQLSMALQMLGSLPASLGYVSLVVLGFHGRLRRWLGALAPAGRMALTNYLLQSLLATWFFYGYGLAQWGMGRTPQLLFVAVVFGLQLLLSHWWLVRFRLGPMEWLWRAATYLQVPRMRQSPGTAASR